MKSGEYSKAALSYSLSIDKQKELIEMNKGNSFSDGRMNFVAGIRYYHKGLALFHLVK